MSNNSNKNSDFADADADTASGGALPPSYTDHRHDSIHPRSEAYHKRTNISDKNPDRQHMKNSSDEGQDTPSLQKDEDGTKILTNRSEQGLSFSGRQEDDKKPRQFKDSKRNVERIFNEDENFLREKRNERKKEFVEEQGTIENDFVNNDIAGRRHGDHEYSRTETPRFDEGSDVEKHEKITKFDEAYEKSREEPEGGRLVHPKERIVRERHDRQDGQEADGNKGLRETVHDNLKRVLPR